MHMLRRGFVAALATTAVTGALLGLSAAPAWATTATGPTYPAPGGNTLTTTPNPVPDGQSAKAGGLTWTYSGFDSTKYTKLFWGVDSSQPPQLAFDGTVDAPGETLTFDNASSDLPNGILRFTGQADIPLANSTAPVYDTRLTVTVTDGVNPIALTATGDLPGQGVDGVSSSIGAVVPVTIASYTVNVLFEASPNGTSWTPALDLYNSLETPSGAPITASQVAGAFYSTPAAAPTAELTPNPLAFGPVKVGTSVTSQLTLHNGGSADLHITGAVFGGDPDFSFDGPSSTCNPANPLTPGDSCLIGLRFTPSAAGARSGTFTLSDDAPDSPQVVNLTGTGTVPGATLTPTPLDFGAVPTASTVTKLATLSNPGTAALAVSGISVTGDVAFSQSGGTCPAAPFSLAASGSCTIGVAFAPTTVSSASGTLSVSDDASGSPQTVSLTGSGLAKADVAVFIGDSSTSVPYGSNVTLTVTVQNRGPSAATDVEMTETIPAKERVVAFSDGGADCLAPPVGSAGTIVCDMDSLAKHATVTITVTVRVVQKQGLYVNNAARITTGSFDPQLRNNHASVATLVT
jgi:uncharacterized repeat protein (TIGR01451 family)